ncbi:hypothetical protein [Niallia sp. MER 6]|uniref:hypothetical protein n=1 Tax=Niallia sp. MER 6 TaxID=2939567 RepID=UPI00203D5D53|nr:hypothetical protein [Niallia sp. MER 6]MCM3032842.1 hypothetical protein [Niallia sp. MER 6]
MTKTIFQINIDTHVLRELRHTVTEEINITSNIKYREQRAWDKICAIMDRLDDTVDYLNGLKLNTGKFSRSAFDFFDFMNNSAVIDECIKELAKIFEVPIEPLKKSTEIFNQLGNDKKGTDELYFLYLRSLCSVHPVETSRHKRYQANDFECSPYASWNNRGLWSDCDLSVSVYTSKDEEPQKRIPVYMSQIFKYVKTRVNFIQEITNVIEQYKEEAILKFKKSNIKKTTDFESYVDYLRNLNNELEKRYGTDRYYDYDYVIKLFELNLSNPKNESKLKLYLNALKYAIEFEHSSLQNMSYEGFENNGLLKPDKNVETSLFLELCSPNSNSEEQRKYRYNIEKIGYLSRNSGYDNRQWAYTQLDEARVFFEKYVTFEEATGDFEHYVLVNLALYLECLENKSLLNKNLPNELIYRQKLLSDKELIQLLTN